MAILLCSGCQHVPTSLTIHPLSRFTVPVGDQHPSDIYIHVEFQDGDGFPCRAVGELVITISSSAIHDVSESIDLSDAHTNRIRFDKMTRTYLVRFNEIPTDLTKVRVLATYTPSTGKKLRTSGNIEK